MSSFSAWADTMKDRNTIYKLIFILSIAFTGLVMLTQGIKNGQGSVALIILVLALIFIVNAGYGGGFSNVPTLLSDHYGMGSISAIHGIPLSAWAFAGLTGNQVATMIVNKTYQWMYMSKDTHEMFNLDDATKMADQAGKTISDLFDKVSPVGYQNVLYFTIALYIVALVLCLLLVKPTDKALEAKAAKKAAAGK